MTAIYNGQSFSTPLLAHWAAFFDLAGWRWSTNIAPVGDWKPDFSVSFDCGHSECGGSHTILVTVLPVGDVSSIQGHPALADGYNQMIQDQGVADAGAVFGANPTATYWDMAHGSGSGSEDVKHWVDDAATLWREAQDKVQTLPQPT